MEITTGTSIGELAACATAPSRSTRQCASLDTSTPTRGHVVGEAHRALHAEAFDDRSERGLDLVAGEVEAVEQELDPLEEHAVGAVGVLLRVDDVAAVAVHEVGDGRDDTGLVGAREQQHRGRAGTPFTRSPRALDDQAGDAAA